MFKKATGILLALSVLVSLAACGNETASAETAASPNALSANAGADVPADAAPDADAAPAQEPSDREKSLAELVAQTNPANKYRELAAAYTLCEDQLAAAVESAAAAGLSEDETLYPLIAEWVRQLSDLAAYLATYANAGEEELNSLDSDEEFLSYSDYFWSDLVPIYNMTRALAEDPVLWLKYYTTVSDAPARELESDGTWPQEYFFSDRVPKLETVDALVCSETGKDFGFEDGEEYAITVNALPEDEALAYIDRLIDAGFREDTRKEAMGLWLWFGRLDDSEGHISAIIVYNANAAGTEESPACMVQFYNYDAIGIMIDIGSLS